MTRWPARLLVDLILRSAAARGGFAAVIAHGDAHSGALLVQCRDRASPGPFIEQQFDGSWAPVGPSGAAEPNEQADYVARRRSVDPDLWVIELDIADAPRFVAELKPTT